MHRRRNVRALFATAVVIIATLFQEKNAQAIPVPILNLPQLTQDAQLIFAGQVISTREIEHGEFKIRGNMVYASRMAATLRVDRAFKGAAGAEISVRFFSTGVNTGYRGVVEDEYGVFFLRRAPEGFVFASPYYPFVIARKEACASKGDALSRVVAEIQCVLRSEAATTRQRVEAIQSLESVKTAAASAVLRSAMKEQPATVNQLAAWELLQRGDISALPLAEKSLQESPHIEIKDTGFSMSTGWSVVLDEIKDRRAAPALIRMLKTPDAPTRCALLRALAQTGVEDAIEPLAQALDDADQQVRWYAVMALAEFAGQDESEGEWYPSMEKFKTDERLYIDHWREWATRRKTGR